MSCWCAVEITWRVHLNWNMWFGIVELQWIENVYEICIQIRYNIKMFFFRQLNDRLPDWIWTFFIFGNQIFSQIRFNDEFVHFRSNEKIRKIGKKCFLGIFFSKFYQRSKSLNILTSCTINWAHKVTVRVISSFKITYRISFAVEFAKT